MKPIFGVMRERRRYNQWVANETLEDFALRFTARRARRWSYLRVTNTALGSISFLALEAIGGAITLRYGFDTAITAIMLVGLLLFLTGIPITYYAAKYGVDIDLLTRGAGFGYIGSTVTSLIYASFTFIFFALEAAILSFALELCFGIPVWLGYLLNALVVIPLATHGFTKISKFQAWTQPFWVILHILPFVLLAFAGYGITDWQAFEGIGPQEAGGMTLIMLGAAAGVAFSLIAQIGEQVDFIRFLPEPKTSGERVKWWTSLMCAGPGWSVIGAGKMLLGSFLLTIAIGAGIAPETAADPNQMYFAAFSQVIDNPVFVLSLTGAFVILSQLKINVTNAYAGSIAWSNFFSRLTHSHPGRVVWMVFNVAIALMLMNLGVFGALEATLAFYSHVALAWIGAIVSDLVINKPLGLSPPHIEFRRAYLYDINPVGLGAMGAACIVSFLAYFGLFGETAMSLSSFIALFTAMLAAPLIAYGTKGRYYIARTAPEMPKALGTCCVCEYRFDPEDMADCPFYEGPICSLCCSLDSVCRDACKPFARIDAQTSHFLKWLLPAHMVQILQSRMVQFLLLTSLISGLIGILLWIIYEQAGTNHFEITLTLIFSGLLFIVGVSVWLFILAHESQRAAWRESNLQSQRLMREVRAHQRTDAELQDARDKAEAASQAKSRYMIGLSHELRTPLNAIFGYAQILYKDPNTPPNRKEAVATIRRSAEHLSGLIEGLLDISKIEAGRIEIYRDRVDFPVFMAQLAGIFEMQAAEKGLTFIYEATSTLPSWITTDEKRLRQILMNLLSNAIRYTERGEVRLTLSYRNEVAHFEVSDTGVGIPAEQIDKIWQPFERAGMKTVRGTGLGLTITKLLVEMMGGEIKVDSVYGQGSHFNLRMMLPSLHRASRPDEMAEARITGYAGPRKSILILDDETDHLQLMETLLAPLGFKLYLASNHIVANEMLQIAKPDLFLLDIDLPDISGWEFAAQLRRDVHRATPIVMVSAHALEGRNQSSGPEDALHDAFIAKPVSFSILLEQVRNLLKIDWTKDIRQPQAERVGPPLSDTDRHDIISLARIGNASEIRRRLDALEMARPDLKASLKPLRHRLSEFDLPGLIRELEETHDAAV
ncbi:MAG: hybrid sensor histidine kinase/response regulator [Sneathiella sp.]|jgi:signal transduction histidine kinase/FixJ family two-component response regulator|uniref:hybrid sensor histidine kinase/response regulator n=1 Tax=Sneathiella sp. TaxID=1964365 RepID=UPI000C4D6879|nr:ATP-binding protein [Sneathiella sp.]MAL77952.1 hybrid sensor histidine kinase/response regulator [Sneathiella sp.]